MTEIPVEQRKIDHRQALVDYLALGPKRSLSKLCQYYAGTVPNPTGLPTLKFWSKRDGWQKAAAEYDTRVAQKVEAKLEKSDAKEVFDLVTEIDGLVEKGVEALKALLSDPDRFGIFKTPQDFSAATNALARLIQTRELIAGRPTARVEMDHRLDAPAWIRDRLQSRLPATQEPPLIEVEHRPDRQEEPEFNELTDYSQETAGTHGVPAASREDR
jgi:hypothetical protein